MSGTALPATHLLRRYLLFALTLVFLLTMLRAGYALWQFTAVAESDALVTVFLHGLRFDLALIGALLIVPVILFTLMSMFSFTRGLVRFLSPLWMMLTLTFVLLVEYVTPWFMATEGVRPGLGEWSAIESPLNLLREVPQQFPIPAAIGGVLCLLILIAFWQRLENHRLLPYPLRKFAAFFSATVGGALCVLAVWSGPIIDGGNPLATSDAGISTDKTVNELTMNTGFKVIATAAENLLANRSSDL